MLRVPETAVIKLQLITSICRGRASPNSSCRDKITHLNAEKINRDEESLYLDLQKLLQRSRREKTKLLSYRGFQIIDTRVTDILLYTRRNI